MYGGGDNSGGGSTRNINNNHKDTLHISPHIAAHKSSGCSSQSSAHSENETSQSHDGQSNSRLAPIQSFANNIPAAYRLGIPTSTIYKNGSGEVQNLEQFQYCIRTHNYPSPLSKALPQDLSAHTNKFTIPVVESSSHQKALPHIHSVGSQALENIASPVIMASERSPTYYKLLDGTTISISSQHQTVLLSSLSDETQNSLHHSHLGTVSQSQSEDNHSIPTSVNSTIPMGMLTGTVAVHQHPSVSGIHEGHIIVPDSLSNNFLSTNENLLPVRDIKNPPIDDIKEEEEIGDHKDLVRQALQAAVAQNSHKSNHDVIEYNYTTDDITGSDDCLVHDDIICHSTFCSQPNIKAQELLMMNINVSSAGTQNSNKVSGALVVGSNGSEGASGGQVVILQPASAMDESGNVLSPVILSSRRRRTRLSEEAQAIRREKIANRMREKRANESEEQKEKRRMREAERMRRKRAQEDEDSKERRRKEAAERARLRRAKLSAEERELERKKAAARMRMRRQNENEEQKRLRRIKAAERMRKRRSFETPEERANRKQNIAIRMKVRRKKKDDDIEKLDSDFPTIDDAVTPTQIEDSKRGLTGHRDMSREGIITTDSNGQYGSLGQHLVVASSLSAVPSNVTLLQSEHTTNANSHILQGTIISAISAVELAHHMPQPLALQVRNSSSPIQRTQNESGDRQPLHLHKGVLISQDIASSHPQDVHLQSRNSDSLATSQAVSLHKTVTSASHIGTHHHLPHLLHHLSPQQDQHHHHQSYILPHQSQSSHQNQQGQPVQLRHQ